MHMVTHKRFQVSITWIVPDGAAGLRHVAHAAAAGALNVVPEGEERVAVKRDSGLF